MTTEWGTQGEGILEGISSSKSIEILELAAATSDFSHKFDSRDAVLLGIEALKCINKARDGGFIPADFLLPGETKH